MIDYIYNILYFTILYYIILYLLYYIILYYIILFIYSILYAYIYTHPFLCNPIYNSAAGTPGRCPLCAAVGRLRLDRKGASRDPRTRDLPVPWWRGGVNV